MNRRNRTILVVGIALAVASLASFGVYKAVQSIPVREVQVAERYMVVANKDVGVGSLLKENDVKVIPWPASSPIAGGFAKAEDVVGRGVITDLVANEVVTENKLAPRESGAGLSTYIPPGMRGMSVRVNDVSGVAGFAVPGKHVDVLVTLRENGQNESISRLVVNNLRVLASGQVDEGAVGRDGKAMTTNVVTLLVTPSDAEKLALAQNQGSIALVLRNPMDIEPVETEGVRTRALIGEPNPQPVRRVVNNQPRMALPPAPAPPKPYTIETIKGAKRDEVTIKKDDKNGGGGGL